MSTGDDIAAQYAAFYEKQQETLTTRQEGTKPAAHGQNNGNAASRDMTSSALDPETIRNNANLAMGYKGVRLRETFGACADTNLPKFIENHVALSHEEYDLRSQELNFLSDKLEKFSNSDVFELNIDPAQIKAVAGRLYKNHSPGGVIDEKAMQKDIDGVLAAPEKMLSIKEEYNQKAQALDASAYEPCEVNGAIFVERKHFDLMEQARTELAGMGIDFAAIKQSADLTNQSLPEQYDSLRQQIEDQIQKGFERTALETPSGHNF